MNSIGHCWGEPSPSRRCDAGRTDYAKNKTILRMKKSASPGFALYFLPKMFIMEANDETGRYGECIPRK
jgi:hypothetical protein